MAPDYYDSQGILDPETFDDMRRELEEIMNRMKSYDRTVPLSQVMEDQQRAEDLYNQLISTIDYILE